MTLLSVLSLSLPCAYAKRDFADALTRQAILQNDEQPGPPCWVEDAVYNQETNNCKCPKGFHSVRCGNKLFNASSFDPQLVMKSCDEGARIYCSKAGAQCKHNSRDAFKSASDHVYYKKHSQAKPEDPFLAQMASISNRINNLGSPVSGWDLVKHWNTADERGCSYVEQAGIYRRDGRCVLTFSSTERVSNISTNAKPFPRDWCGLKSVQAGYANRLDVFMNGVRFQEFMDFLNSDTECPNGIIGVGHSMGAGLISLMAVCGNNKGLFKMNELYTFAGPGVSKKQLTNSLSPDGCFKGARIYNQDRFMQDPIPALSSPFGYKHPKLAEIRLKQQRGKPIEVIKYRCDDKHVKTHPHWKSKASNPMLHLAGSAYVKRLLQVPEASKGLPESPVKATQPAEPSPMR